MASAGSAHRAGYHHGNLRAALLEAAVGIITEEGLSALTLRRAAREAGVSHTAPKHHFGDLRGLLAAIAETGYEELRREMDSSGHAADSCMSHLGQGYVRFAIENPGRFRAMFHPSLGDRDDLPGLQAAATRTLALVEDTVRRCQGAGIVRPGDAHGLALLAWSTVHGFACLAIDDQLTAIDDLEPLEDRLGAVLRNMFQGLAGPRHGTILTV